MATIDKLITFDKLIQEIGARYHLGPKGRSLVQETLDLIARQPGGIDGFLDRFKAAGFAAKVASWVGRTDAMPLSGQEVEEALGSDVVSEIADKAGVSQRFARTILGYAIPKIIGQLEQGRATLAPFPVAASIPPEADWLSSSRTDELTLPGAEQIAPSRMGGAGAPGFGRLLIPGACVLITLGFLGYAILSGGSGTHTPVRSAPVMAQNAPAAVPPAPSNTAPLAPSKPVASPPAPSIPARLALSNENGLIVYSGTVGNDATRAAITDSLKTVFGADKISGDLAIDPRAGPAGWTNGLKGALDNFKTLGSQALFEGNAVSAGGTIPDADRDRIISAVKSALGPQFAVAALAASGPTKTAAPAPALSSGLSGKTPVGAPKEQAIHLPVIYFAANSAKVSSSSKVRLLQAAGLMKQMPAKTVVQINGYTDSAGNPTTNRKLSQRRADAVRQVLVHAGINPAMLIANGYGSSRPLASEPGTMEGRSNGAEEDRRGDNRRVEFSIVQQ
jgi:outer membrane protein OmpA-like peptidoglycan-associated protein/uncharacterized protein YidB (DUF937 family)